MTEENRYFKIRDDLNFWILEQRKEQYSKEDLNEYDEEKLLEIINSLKIIIEEGSKKKDIINAILEKYNADAWVFNNEKEAISKMKILISNENTNLDNLESIEEIGRKYNLQEVQIVKDKINLKAVSWLKVFLLSTNPR